MKLKLNVMNDSGEERRCWGEQWKPAANCLPRCVRRAVLSTDASSHSNNRRSASMKLKKFQLIVNFMAHLLSTSRFTVASPQRNETARCSSFVVIAVHNECSVSIDQHHRFIFWWISRSLWSAVFLKSCYSYISKLCCNCSCPDFTAASTITIFTVYLRRSLWTR